MLGSLACLAKGTHLEDWITLSKQNDTHDLLFLLKVVYQ